MGTDLVDTTQGKSNLWVNFTFIGETIKLKNPTASGGTIEMSIGCNGHKHVVEFTEVFYDANGEVTYAVLLGFVDSSICQHDHEPGDNRYGFVHDFYKASVS